MLKANTFDDIDATAILRAYALRSCTDFTLENAVDHYYDAGGAAQESSMVAISGAVKLARCLAAAVLYGEDSLDKASALYNAIALGDVAVTFCRAMLANDASKAILSRYDINEEEISSYMASALALSSGNVPKCSCVDAIKSCVTLLGMVREMMYDCGIPRLPSKVSKIAAEDLGSEARKALEDDDLVEADAEGFFCHISLKEYEGFVQGLLEHKDEYDMTGVQCVDGKASIDGMHVDAENGIVFLPKELVRIIGRKGLERRANEYLDILGMFIKVEEPPALAGRLNAVIRGAVEMASPRRASGPQASSVLPNQTVQLPEGIETAPGDRFLLIPSSGRNGRTVTFLGLEETMLASARCNTGAAPWRDGATFAADDVARSAIVRAGNSVITLGPDSPFQPGEVVRVIVEGTGFTVAGVPSS